MNKQLACPQCKSTNLVKCGIRFRFPKPYVFTATKKKPLLKAHLARNPNAQQQKDQVQQYQCNNCGRITINPIYLPPRDNKGRFTKFIDTSTPAPSEVPKI